MNRIPLVAAFLFIGCGAAVIKAPNESTNVAEYELTFVGMWNAQSHPLEYPGGAHFSGLIGATHNGDYNVIVPDQAPTMGLERLSEEGKHSPLDMEIRAAIAMGKAGTLFETGPVKDQSVPATATIRVDANHPMVSFVAMIAPSPDWFTGAANVMLWENGAWVAEKTIELEAWDSGGDDGKTYKADDVDNNPKKPTMINNAPQFMKDGKRVPVAKVVIRKK